MRKILIAALAATMAPCAFAQYQIDDGTREDGIGAGDVFLVWSNSFVTVAGSEVITSLDFQFGNLGPVSGGNVDMTGTAVNVFLMADANLDGIPDNASPLASMAGTIGAGYFGTGVWQNFNISDTVLTVGSGFCAMAIVDSVAGGFPMSWDSSDPDLPLRSYVGFNTTAISANNIGAIPSGQRGFIETFGLPGNWMIRANATAVPEPATMAALGLGAVALIRRRRAK